MREAKKTPKAQESVEFEWTSNIELPSRSEDIQMCDEAQPKRGGRFILEGSSGCA